MRTGIRDLAEGESEALCGRMPIWESLRAGRRRFHRLLVQIGVRECREVRAILKAADQRAVPVERTGRATLDRMARGAHHQGMVLLAGGYPYVNLDELMAVLSERRKAVVVILDHVMDPQNVGAILRASEAFGVDGVVIPLRGCAPVTPAVVRASSGAAEHVRVARVVSLTDTLLRLRKEGLLIVGLEVTGGAVSCEETDLTGPVGLVLGGEGTGLSRQARYCCDLLATIPLSGETRSLNVAMATAVTLYEASRQRRLKDKIKRSPQRS